MAVSGEKIKDLPEIKIRESLRYAMVKIGLRANNFPKGVEKSLLIDHVYQNFGGLTPAEIRMAFDWAIDGRLDIDDINCYENFSCAYVSKILKAYIKLKGLIGQEQELKQIEYKPDLEEIEREYQAFINDPKNKRFLPDKK